MLVLPGPSSAMTTKTEMTVETVQGAEPGGF
jgi:hypothetical protein